MTNEVDLVENYLEAMEEAKGHQPMHIQNAIYEILDYNVNDHELYADPPTNTIAYPSVDIHDNYLGPCIIPLTLPLPGKVKLCRFVVNLVDIIQPMEELIAGMSVITTTVHDILMHVMRTYPSLHPDEVTLSTTTWYSEQDMNIFISAYMTISTTIASRLKALGIYSRLHNFAITKNAIVFSAETLVRF